jgi:alpha-galactosidase
VTVGTTTIEVERASVERAEVEPGVTELTFSVEPDSAGDVTFSLLWRTHAGDAIAYWHPHSVHRSLGVEWTRPRVTNALKWAPIGTLHDTAGTNVETFALDEVVEPVHIQAGVEEETSRFLHRVKVEGVAPQSGPYVVRMRIDQRMVPYSDALHDVAAWWLSLSDTPSLPVPDLALVPVYSTWYSFHQRLEPAAVARQAALARDIGCKVLIVDDGWMTTDAARGYAFTGDWEVEPSRLGDLATQAADAAAAGGGYLLWIAPPFVGMESAAWERFQDKLLTTIERLRCGVLDPRYKDVRDHLVSTCVALVRDYNLIGLKIDFVDTWPREEAPPAGPGADFERVEEAVDAFLATLTAELRAVRPDVLVEFRQNYIGPRMWRYANLFRAGDCPMDRIDNRVRTVDLRLLTLGSAVQADMLMWDRSWPAELAAEQLLAVLFAVPQISVLLDQVPSEHLDMLRFWLGFVTEHRDTLFRGRIESPRPDLQHPLVRAHGAGTTVAAAYTDLAVTVRPMDQPDVWVANATGGDSLIVEVLADAPVELVGAQDCRGNASDLPAGELTPGLHRLPVPRSGLLHLRKV